MARLVADSNKHICEVQLVHNMMMTARKGLPGHAVYNRVRNASELFAVMSGGLAVQQPQSKEELKTWLIEYHAGKDWKEGEEKNGDKFTRGDPNLWDVTKIEDMSQLFNHNALKDFNKDIGDWNVFKVENMESMFYQAEAFNQPIGNWDVSNVKKMESMFLAAKEFNQPIGNWDVSNVKNMESMFRVAKAFNQPIGNWDVSKVKDMEMMFAYAAAFNQPIEKWDVSKVENMNKMFYRAKAFNQSLPGGWKLEDLKRQIARW